MILKILLFEEKICTSGPEVLVNTCDPPFTILDICNDLLTHVLKIFYVKNLLTEVSFNMNGKLALLHEFFWAEMTAELLEGS